MAKLQPLRPLVQNASVLAADVLRGAIVDGSLIPGERLKEERLANELGISRTPVREALLILQSEGLVEMVPNRGSFVRMLSTEELLDTYQLRALLEGYGARLAASCLTEEHFIELRSIASRFEALADRFDKSADPDVRKEVVQGLVAENIAFHKVILENAGSPRLLEVLAVIAMPLAYRTMFDLTRTQVQSSVLRHYQIVRALESRDSERTEMLMKEHIFEARDHLVAIIRSREAE
jgi:DNA-binding GntR family transcriptional regulator